MTKRTAKLPDGTKVEGTTEQINRVARALGYGDVIDSVYHFSRSKGQYILIQDMATSHIRNTILAQEREFVASLRDETVPLVVLQKLREGPSTAEYRALVAEYAIRDPE